MMMKLLSSSPQITLQAHLLMLKPTGCQISPRHSANISIKSSFDTDVKSHHVIRLTFLSKVPLKQGAHFYNLHIDRSVLSACIFSCMDIIKNKRSNINKISEPVTEWTSSRIKDPTSIRSVTEWLLRSAGCTVNKIIAGKKMSPQITLIHNRKYNSLCSLNNVNKDSSLGLPSPSKKKKKKQ